MRNVAAVALALALGACTLDQMGAGAKGQDAGDSGGAGGSGGFGGTAGSGGTSGSGGSSASGGSGGSGCFPGPNEKVCGIQCVAIDDPAFGCGADSCSACVTPKATSRCEEGACSIVSCDDGYRDCNTDPIDGCEVSFSDPRHCGGCGNDCFSDPTGLEWDCVDHRCVASECPTGTRNCNGDPADECETDIRTSVLHCGFCGNECDLANATARCEGGRCVIDACNPGYADCDGNPANGCEVFTPTDLAHCGACGHACSDVGASTRTCQEGVCKPVCQTGRGDCGTPTAPNADDGCETDVNAAVDHCGACGRACAGGSHVQARRCEAGLCDPTCVRGRGSCSSPAAPTADDGCETDVDTNVSHCGGCNRPCDDTNATARACSAGVCAPSCASGFGDCSSPTPDNGCETPTSGDPDNCGGCNIVCSSTQVDARECTAGSCTPKCNEGYLDCNRATANDGCEADATSAATCGACNVSCGAGQACTAGACVGTGGSSGTGGTGGTSGGTSGAGGTSGSGGGGSGGGGTGASGGSGG
ncbi:MAG: hypothetical protein KIT72_15080 [Polyangiaceae bacterium]|nr:hypothetical protein [Polyangiaceae bacterium]MCW5791740.1 hypothetical protein [Polyangiaceae bacterium]